MTKLDDEISFVHQYIEIKNEEVKVIKYCRKSLLFKNGEAWKKKSTGSTFDITMGCNDESEICELVGSYIIYTVEKKN